MPTPDGREWLTSDKIADFVMEGMDRNLPPQAMAGQDRAAMKAAVVAGFQGTNYHYEFKILRLIEKVKDAIWGGAFGPLTIPNTVDAEGMKIPTPVGEVAMLLRDCYTPEFLDQFDEEGNPLEEA